jgi:hypothetical protein
MSTESLVAWEERDEVLRRRYQEALQAGMKDKDADLFARSDVDVGELRRVVRKGCPKRLIAKLVL